MKVQLDFTRKEITLESNVNLKEFFDQVKTLLPDWKEWSLSTNNILYSTISYIPWTWVEPFNPYWNNPQPTIYTTFGAGSITFDMSQQSQQESQNIYCLDIN